MNHQIFERMLCFRVLLEACLFECLFSPLAFSSLAEDGADFGVSGRPPFYEGSLPRLPKWRDDETALPFAVGNTLSTQNLNQRGATQVKTMFGIRDFLPSSLWTFKGTPNRPSFPRECVSFSGRAQQGNEPNKTFRTSNQARGPAEFKHITKRRKRN